MEVACSIAVSPKWCWKAPATVVIVARTGNGPTGIGFVTLAMGIAASGTTIYPLIDLSLYLSTYMSIYLTGPLSIYLMDTVPA